MCTTLTIHNYDAYEELWAAMYYVGWSAYLGGAIADVMCVQRTSG